MWRLLLIFYTSFVCTCTSVLAQSLKFGPPTSIPAGWIAFCGRNPSQCSDTPTEPVRIIQDSNIFNILISVNERINHTIRPLSDIKHWGVEDQWDIPTDGYGDCEDYALLKRKILIEKGLPVQALLMAVVRDSDGEGHAVLLILLDKETYVLDNLTDEVVGWHQTPYEFLKSQSLVNQNAWVALESDRRDASIAKQK